MPERSALAGTAELQYGLFTAKQALDCGVSYKVLRHWQAAGTVVERHPGVFAFAGAPETKIWWRPVAHMAKSAPPEAVRRGGAGCPGRR